MPTCGVLYIAFGDRCVREAVHSARSLKRHSPTLPVMLLSDRKERDPVFDEVRVIEVKHARAKVDFLADTPYERTLYIDSDTEVQTDLREAFDVLDRFDLAATQSIGRKNAKWSERIPEYAAIPYAFPEYNGGLVLYRRGPAMDAFLALWKQRFYAYQKESDGRDQPSFRIALWQSDCRIHTLAPEYNVRSQAHRDRVGKQTDADGFGKLKPRVLHWHGLEKGKLRLRAKYRPFRF